MSKYSGVRAGEAFVDFSIRDNNVNTWLNAFQARLGNIAFQLKTIGRALFMMGAGIVGAFVAPLQAAGRLEETMNKIKVVSGSLDDDFDMQESLWKNMVLWAQSFATSVGRAKRDVIEWTARAQGTFVPLGFDRKTAANMAKKIVSRAIDLGSFMDMPDEEAFVRLNSALTGYTRQLRAFNSVILDTRIKQEAIRRGWNDEINQMQKAQIIFDLLMEDTKDAQGDAIRTQDSFVNQLKRTGSTLTDIAVAFGQAVAPAVTGVMIRFNKLKDTLVNIVEKNQDLVKWVFDLGVKLVKIGAPIWFLGAALEIFNRGLTSMRVLLPFVAKGLAGVLNPVMHLIWMFAALKFSFLLIVSVLGFLLNPLNALGLIILAATAAWVRFTKEGNEAKDMFLDLAKTIAGRFMATWKDMLVAIKQGDLKGALAVALASAKIAFNEFMLTFAEGFYQNAAKVVRTLLDMKLKFLNFFDALSSKLKLVWEHLPIYLKMAEIRILGFMDKLETLAETLKAQFSWKAIFNKDHMAYLQRSADAEFTAAEANTQVLLDEQRAKLTGATKKSASGVVVRSVLRSAGTFHDKAVAQKYFNDLLRKERLHRQGLLILAKAEYTEAKRKIMERQKAIDLGFDGASLGVFGSAGMVPFIGIVKRLKEAAEFANGDGGGLPGGGGAGKSRGIFGAVQRQALEGGGVSTFTEIKKNTKQTAVELLKANRRLERMVDAGVFGGLGAFN